MMSSPLPDPVYPEEDSAIGARTLHKGAATTVTHVPNAFVLDASIRVGIITDGTADSRYCMTQTIDVCKTLNSAENSKLNAGMPVSNNMGGNVSEMDSMCNVFSA